jgi:hypothetical protein
MTVSSTVRTAGPYFGTGLVTIYPFAFKVFANTDVIAQVTASGDLDELVYGSDFTVTLNADQNTSPGGNVLLSAPLAVGSTLEIGSLLAQTQPTRLTNAGGFLPQTIEDALDRGVILLQQAAGDIGGAIRVPEIGGVPPLPPASQRALLALGCDAAGNVVPFAPTSGSASDLALMFLAPGGAGLVGRGASISYGAGTLGAELTGVINAAALSGIDRTGVADCTAAINNASLLVKRMYFPSGTYLLNAALLRSDLEIFGDGDSTILRPLTTGTFAVFYCDSGSADPANNISNVYIHDVQFRGWSDTAGLSEHLHLVAVNGVSKVVFERVTFRAPRGDGVYVGSSLSPGLERHNFGVTFRKCHFDGVNHSNRNGISIIDCVGFTVDDCLFENITDPTMPGAIDVEPNSGWNVCRDIKVENSRFYKTGGAAGWFAVQVGNLGSTTPTSGYRLEGNTIDSMGYTADREKGLLISLYGDASSVTYPLDFKMSRNTFRDIRNLARVDGAAGVKIKDNDFLGTVGDAQWGLTYRCLNVDLEGNTFSECGNDNSLGGKCLTFGEASYLGVRNNRFLNCGKVDGTAGVAINFDTGSSDNVTIEQNTATGTRTLAAVTVVGHTLTPASNILRQNAFGSLASSDFQAGYGSKVYDPPSVAAGAATGTTVSAPGARLGRPVGVSFSLDLQGIFLNAFVSASDVVTVTLFNPTIGAIDLGSGTLSVWAPPV